jgi:hypothetical protein
MVELGRQATDELRSAIDQALRSGIKAEAIADMVVERTIYHEVATPSDIIEFLNHHQDKTPPDDEGAVIYDELPPGLIDLPSASRKYGVNLKTATGWLKRGRIPKMGKLRAPGPGGGYNLTCETAFKEMAGLPKDHGGRPRKT